MRNSRAMKFWYKDFATNKLRWTRARFIGWTEPTGPLNTPYAIFQRKSDDLLIPRYSLTAESLSALNVLTTRDQKTALALHELSRET